MRAWDSLVKDDEMLAKGNLSKEEPRLVLHFREHAPNAQAYPLHSVAIITPHYAQMLWLQHCVWEAGRRLHGDQAYECVQVIATLDRFQGLQPLIVLASMVSSEPGIMKDVVRANTLTSKAQSELHLFGPLFGWDQSPLTAGWLSNLMVMADQLRQGASQEQVQSVRLPGVLYQQPTLAKPEAGVIYKFKGWGRALWGSGFGSRGKSMQKPSTLGDPPPPPK